MLGRVELHVGGKPLRVGRAKSAELLVYLAMHPGGADLDELWEALWPERPVSPYLLYTTVSEARRCLRRQAGDSPEVRDARGGKLYQLAAPVSVDWHRFVELVTAGDEGRVPEIEAMSAALALVRGPPFSGGRSLSYDWARPERVEIEDAIGAVAERFGYLLLERGDILGARRVARRGLVAVPYDERLYGVLMHAAKAANHPAGVTAVQHELADLMGVAAPDVPNV